MRVSTQQWTLTLTVKEPDLPDGTAAPEQLVHLSAFFVVPVYITDPSRAALRKLVMQASSDLSRQVAEMAVRCDGIEVTK